MKRTMKGFLLSECNRLIGLDKHTTSLKKLYCAAAKPSGARAREYVFLFALESNKLDVLSDLAGKDASLSFNKQCIRLMPVARPFEGDAEEFLMAYGEELGKRFVQVLDAFHAPALRMENDLRVKGIMREKMLTALHETGTTPYAMVRDLGLNKGNAYAYLRGDCTKVSRESARRMYDYAIARLQNQ